MGLLGLFRRPALFTAAIAIVAYWDSRALRGKFVYDDAGSVAKNVVVNGQVPWEDAFTRDFWGTPMKEPASHKSFRPITTLSFKMNWLLAERYGQLDTDDHTLYFHLFNIFLHGLNTGLVTEAAAFVFDDFSGVEGDVIAQLITGLLFGLHPVHAEAVSNITSRGELLMTLFFLLAFLSFASQINAPHPSTDKNNPTTQTTTWLGTARYILCLYCIPWIMMAASMFSKEQGATTLCSLVAYDFIKHHHSVQEFFPQLLQWKRSAWNFVGRTIVLALQTLSLVALRYWLNGESSPDFIYDQNPAGFSEDRLTRVFSVSWVYVLYIRDAIYPYVLSPDWSGVSIDLITDISDNRALLVIFLWIFALWCVQSLAVGLPPNAPAQDYRVRKILLMAFFAFLFLPFLLSSNLLVVVGLMKADRVIYLPLLGFCIMEALLFQTMCCSTTETADNTTATKDQQQHSSQSPPSNNKVRVYWFGHLLVLTQLGFFAAKLHERNIAWSSPELLWIKAFNVNPRSHHTMYNCGYELSLRQRYEEAEQVMSPIGNAHVDGPSNTFVYAMVLYNLHRCDEANYYIDIAMEVLEEQRQEGGVRYQDSALDRTKSNLLVARGYCTTDDMQEQGRVLQEAVRVDPRNTYAVQQFQAYLNKLQQLREMEEKYGIQMT